MDDEIGYDAASERSLPSSDISLSVDQSKKPCEICGSNANENKLMTCFTCRVTREHIYCMRVVKQFVPALWVCDECRSSERSNQVVGNEDSIDQTASTSSNHQVVDNQVNMMTTGDSCVQTSATHQPSQAHPSPVVTMQKLPDPNLLSDSESAAI